MTSPLDRLRRDYLATFVAHLSRSDEDSLHRAYELGRHALAGDISLLDLVRTHHSVLGEILKASDGVDTQRELLDHAAAFLVEALAPFEIARRGFMETSTPHHDQARRTHRVDSSPLTGSGMPSRGRQADDRAGHDDRT